MCCSCSTSSPHLTPPPLQVRWAPTTQHHTLNSPYSLRLASVDQSCVCVVWDVGEGGVYTEFSLGTRTLVDLQWLSINVSEGGVTHFLE